MISVKNLTKEFLNAGELFRACDDVSFDVGVGEIYGIIGLSGAGKSTILRCLNLLEKPTSGAIFINGKDICKISNTELLALRKKVSMIFQGFNLFKQKTVFENIAYPLRLLKKNLIESGKVSSSKNFEKYLAERVNELASFIDLSDKLKSYPNELSGGQKQRVAIARALATEPKILLCDEATSALDPSNTKQVLNLIKKAVTKFNMTCIVITHQMEVAKTLCDRIAVMQAGKIIEENTVEELFQNPKTTLTKSFIGKLHSEPLDEVFSADSFSSENENFSGKLVRLTYSYKTVNLPVLNDCIKTHEVSINFLAGNINNLKTGQVGFMIVAVDGDDAEIKKALQFLRDNNVGVEIVNLQTSKAKNFNNGGI